MITCMCPLGSTRLRFRAYHQTKGSAAPRCGRQASIFWPSPPVVASTGPMINVGGSMLILAEQRRTQRQAFGCASPHARRVFRPAKATETMVGHGRQTRMRTPEQLHARRLQTWMSKTASARAGLTWMSKTAYARAGLSQPRSSLTQASRGGARLSVELLAVAAAVRSPRA